MTVHGLLYGRAVCGTMTGPPSEWPDDHLWVYVDDLKNMNCAPCLRAMARMSAEEKP